MQRTPLLPEQQDDFTRLVKKSTKHRDATELLKYNPVEYKSYLRDIKTSAGSRSKYDSKGLCTTHRAASRRQQRPSTRQSERQEQPVAKLPRSNSYYYTNRCQLLSLKEFNILVERAQSQQKRERQKSERQSRKRLIKMIEDSVQPSNKVQLRLTSAVANRMRVFIDP